MMRSFQLFMALVVVLRYSTLGTSWAVSRTDCNCKARTAADEHILTDRHTTLPTRSQHGKQPVIIDTDMGSFDDDPVAIAFALSRPELDVKLVITCSDHTTERARIAAKYLTLIGRDDLPVGIGDNRNISTNFHIIYRPWANGYNNYFQLQRQDFY